jgi:serine/threonine protein kinase
MSPSEPDIEAETSLHAPAGAEFVASEPRVPSHSISSAAFSRNYFKSFFVEEKELGRGGRGVVLLVSHVLDNVHLGQFACKRVPVGDDHAWLEKVLVEVQTLQNLSHPNLVSYRHVWLEDYQINKFGPSVPCAFILQQYCNGGDLHDYVLTSANHSTMTARQMKERMRRRSKGQMEEPFNLEEPRRMQFEEIFSFFKDITSGLHHLHSHGFIHRDIKPNNCLLLNTGTKIQVLLSDFGEVQAANSTRKSSGATGTISYCAPEVLKRVSPGGVFGNFTVKSDIFSLGMIVFFMCFGRLPYSNADGLNEENEDVDRLREEIAAWAGFDADEIRARDDLPDRLYRFLNRLLSIDPNARPTTEEILYGIRAGQDLDGLDSIPRHMNDRRGSRITPAESPSPHPRNKLFRRERASSIVQTSSSLVPSTSPEIRRSPSPPKSPIRRHAKPVDPQGAIIRARKRSDEDLPILPPHSPRLALPPPPLQLPLFTANTWLLLIRAIKVALFLFKYLSLSTPCHPMSSNGTVAYPLLALATLDFVLPLSRSATHQQGPKSTGALLLAHLVIVWAAKRLGWLCKSYVPYGINHD